MLTKVLVAGALAAAVALTAAPAMAAATVCYDVHVHVQDQAVDQTGCQTV